MPNPARARHPSSSRKHLLTTTDLSRINQAVEQRATLPVKPLDNANAIVDNQGAQKPTIGGGTMKLSTAEARTHLGELGFRPNNIEVSFFKEWVLKNGRIPTVTEWKEERAKYELKNLPSQAQLQARSRWAATHPSREEMVYQSYDNNDGGRQ